MTGPSEAGRRFRRGSIKHRLTFWGLALLTATLALNTFAGSVYTGRGMQNSTAQLQAAAGASAAGRCPSSVARRETHVGPVFTSNRAKPYVTLAVPLKPSPQETGGVLITQTNLKFLWEVIREIQFGHRGYAYLVNETGLLIAHADPSWVLKY